MQTKQSYKKVQTLNKRIIFSCSQVLKKIMEVSYNLFLEFIKSNKVEDLLRGKYIRLYKKAIWTKRLCLLLLLSLFILMPLLSALKLW